MHLTGCKKKKKSKAAKTKHVDSVFSSDGNMSLHTGNTTGKRKESFISKTTVYLAKTIKRAVLCLSPVTC